MQLYHIDRTHAFLPNIYPTVLTQSSDWEGPTPWWSYSNYLNLYWLVFQGPDAPVSKANFHKAMEELQSNSFRMLWLYRSTWTTVRACLSHFGVLGRNQKSKEISSLKVRIILILLFPIMQQAAISEENLHSRIQPYWSRILWRIWKEAKLKRELKPWVYFQHPIILICSIGNNIQRKPQAWKSSPDYLK
jgi:hypothetical protein